MLQKKEHFYNYKSVLFLLFKTFYLKYYKNFSTLKSFQGAKSVGEKMQPNFETLLQLKPDVITSSTKFPAETAEKFTKDFDGRGDVGHVGIGVHCM